MNDPMFELVGTGTTTVPEGFEAGAVACGLKPGAALDLALFLSDRNASVAGTFTQNQFAAAPVKLDRTTLASGPARMRAVIANAGNANACTGERGDRDAAAMQQACAEALGLAPEQVLVLSTGVIGAPLPMRRICEGIRALPPTRSKEGGLDAARAIMTTDTVPKHAALKTSFRGHRFSLGGTAKGSGMIHPNMATMLAVVTTDAQVPAPFLQHALKRAVSASFNAISVDGDTSTNDTVLLLANGASGLAIESPESQQHFQHALTELCTVLAKQIVHDGEGATHVVEINVSGMDNDHAARKVAETIATSALVKTAIAGGDPNWGRILAAAGRAGPPIDTARASLMIEAADPASRVVLVRDGMPTDYAETAAAAVFKEREFTIHVGLGGGPGKATMWTTDLTHEYVSINADYRS